MAGLRGQRPRGVTLGDRGQAGQVGVSPQAWARNTRSNGVRRKRLVAPGRGRMPCRPDTNDNPCTRELTSTIRPTACRNLPVPLSEAAEGARTAPLGPSVLLCPRRSERDSGSAISVPASWRIALRASALRASALRATKATARRSLQWQPPHESRGRWSAQRTLRAAAFP